jgi:Domain of unknown function (DUF4440)
MTHHRTLLRFLCATLALFFVTACTSRPDCAPAAAVDAPAVVDAAAEKQAMVDLIGRMEAAWNRGDFRGYMEGFANPDVIFVSRGEIQKDWQGTLDHYVRDYGASEATRGALHFSNIRVEMLAPDAAQLISNFQLDRPNNLQNGVNTRLMRKRDGKWVIWLNHVSSREVTPPGR